MIWSISKQPDIKFYLSEEELDIKDSNFEISWLVFDHIRSTTIKVVLIFWNNTSPYLETWETYEETWSKVYIPKSEIELLKKFGRTSARFDWRMSKYYILLQDHLQSEDLFWFEYLKNLLSK